MKTATEFLWPDGTWHTQTHEDYLNSTITKSRLFYERLRFIFKRVYFFCSHFKCIKVSKSIDNSGQFEYAAKIAYSFKLEGKDVSEVTNLTVALTSPRGGCD